MKEIQSTTHRHQFCASVPFLCTLFSQHEQKLIKPEAWRLFTPVFGQYQSVALRASIVADPIFGFGGIEIGVLGLGGIDIGFASLGVLKLLAYRNFGIQSVASDLRASIAAYRIRGTSKLAYQIFSIKWCVVLGGIDSGLPDL